MIRRQFVIGICVIISIHWILWHRETPAQEPRDREHSLVIKGGISDFDARVPMEGATVKVYTYRGLNQDDITLVREAKTNAEGTFEFSNLRVPHGHRYNRLMYMLVMSAPGKVSAAWPVYAINAAEIRVGLSTGDANVKGKLVDENGNPIEGALVEQSHLLPSKFLGNPSYTTKDDGLFYLKGIREGKAYIQITHPDFPVQAATRQSGSFTTVRLKSGTTIVGRIVDRRGNPRVGMMVSAIPWNAYPEIRDKFATTDENGNFRLVVLEGTYKLMSEDENYVFKAKKLDCRKGQTLNLGEIKAIEGGWIVGQISNSDTKKPVLYSTREGEQDVRVTLGLVGPSRPQGRLIHQWQLAEVDEKGQFRMRAYPGENYPYVYNLGHTTRTCFNIDEYPPVIVEAGKETRIDILHTPKRTPEQLMAAAQKIVDGLPNETEPRVKAIVEEFRKLNHTVDECERWCLLVRELVNIGKSAVPALCDALDEAEKSVMLRRLAFTLRAIGDPRAVPALIRAIPRTLQPASSDYGLIVKDASLTEFMQKHQIGSRGGQHFSFGRPVREVHETLRVLTKHGPQQSPLNWMHRRKDLRAVAAQQKQFHAEAKKWTKWWESNWNQLGVPEAYSKVNLPEPILPDLSDYPSNLEITTKAEKDTGSSRDILSPIGAKDGGTYFIDLDVGHRYGWPNKLPKGDVSRDAITKINDWAEGRGVDLMCHVIPTSENVASYVLVGVNTQFWEIDKFDAKNIESFLAKGKLPTGRKVDGRLLLHHDPKSRTFLPARNTSFLYLTNDQGIGIITITDFVTEKQNMAGAVMLPAQGVGRNRGVRFNYHGIAR